MHYICIYGRNQDERAPVENYVNHVENRILQCSQQRKINSEMKRTRSCRQHDLVRFESFLNIRDQSSLAAFFFVLEGAFTVHCSI